MFHLLSGLKIIHILNRGPSLTINGCTRTCICIGSASLSRSYLLADIILGYLTKFLNCIGYVTPIGRIPDDGLERMPNDAVVA